MTDCLVRGVDLPRDAYDGLWTECAVIDDSGRIVQDGLTYVQAKVVAERTGYEIYRRCVSPWKQVRNGVFW